MSKEKVSMSDEMDFSDLKVRQITVPIFDKKYILREASGRAAVNHRNSVLSCTKLNAEGKPSEIKNLANTEPFLISMCLFETDENGKVKTDENEKEKNVTQDVIMALPSRVQKRLFQWIKDNSEMVEEDSAEKVALEKALSLAGSPLNLPDFKAYVRSLEGKEYRPLQLWYEQEEAAKNEPSDTTAGSASPQS